jgi:WD40 repeat protein
VLYHTLQGNSYPIKRVIFSSDGKLLACSYSGHGDILIWNIITGAKEQTWTVDDIKDRDMDEGVDGLDFFQNGSFLMGDMGEFNPHSRPASCDTSFSEKKRGISFQLLEGEWIALNGEKVMWLPPKIRPTCSATHGRVLALGHASGRVTFIGA